MGMDPNTDEFNSQFLEAVDAKAAWFNSSQLPKIQEDYRLHFTCINNLTEALEKRGLITADPYKKDKKITNVQKIDDSPFNETDRNQKLGIRLGDYQAMLDYICNYVKFTTDYLNMDKIKRLLEFNASFNWQNLTANSPKMNTQALASCIAQLRTGAQQLQIAMISDSITKARTSIEEITLTLKELAIFQRESYKGEIRRKVFTSGKINPEKTKSTESYVAEIKRVFPDCMGKRFYSAELVEELVNEEISPKKDELRRVALAKISIEEKKSEKVENTVDTHSVIMETVRILGALHEQYDIVLGKITTNNKILQSSRNTFKDKILRLIRQVFGMSEPEIDYTISIMDSKTQTSRKEKLNFTEFVNNMSKRTKYYATIAQPNGAGYVRINSQEEKVILDFVNKQLAENGRLHVVLTALDNFFKATAPATEKSKIKGIKMELTSLKNILVKANQARAEYIAYIEEREQMKRLGITNE